MRQCGEHSKQNDGKEPASPRVALSWRPDRFYAVDKNHSVLIVESDPEPVGGWRYRVLTPPDVQGNARELCGRGFLSSEEAQAAAEATARTVMQRWPQPQLSVREYRA